VDVVVEKAVHGGLGLARHDGEVVFVPRGVAGERLRVRIEARGKGFARARVAERLLASPERREAPCAHAGPCGGCSYQDLIYPAQLALKKDVLIEALARAHVAWDGEIEIEPSPEAGWRLRAGLHLERRGGELALGFREEGTHRLLDVTRCLQLSDRMNAAARGLLEGLRRRPGGAAGLRGIDLAESLDGAQCVACLDTELSPGKAAGFADLAASLPWLSGLSALAGGGGGSRAFVPLHGSPLVHHSLAGVRLRQHVRSFFQGNRFLVGRLVSLVAELLPPGERLLDLYAGVGLFALPLAGRFAEVLAAETDESAVEDARANLRDNGIGNVRFERRDVGDALESWPAASGESVVLDPPRAGAGRAVVEAVARRRPRAIVYVSCDPATLARDLALFGGLGYRPSLLRALDLFPDTFHVETVARLVPDAV
jgi:23S rRNA (uracil1939-C5)-methyltransferase